MTVDPLLQHTAALLLSAVLAAGAAGKLTAFTEFEGVVGNYRLLPALLVKPVAWAIPALEIVLALALIVPAARVPAAAATIALLGVFAAAMGINIARGRTDIDCGCFRTAHRQHLTWWLVLRNLVLMAFVALCLAPEGARLLGWLDWVQMTAAVAALFLVYVAVSGVFLPRPPTFDENYARSLDAGS